MPERTDASQTQSEINSGSPIPVGGPEINSHLGLETPGGKDFSPSEKTVTFDDQPDSKVPLDRLKKAQGYWNQKLAEEMNKGPIPEERLEEVRNLKAKGILPISGGEGVYRVPHPKYDKDLRHEVVDIDDPNMCLGYVLETLEVLKERNPKSVFFDKSPAENPTYVALMNTIDSIDPLTGPMQTIFTGTGPTSEVVLDFKGALKQVVHSFTNIHNRAVSVRNADAVSIALGVVPPDARAQNPELGVDPVDPEDWWTLIHLEDMFPGLNVPEARVPVSGALDIWRRVGEYYNVLVPGAPISYKDALNQEGGILLLDQWVAEETSRRSGSNQAISSSAADIASDILTCSLSFDMWDYEREENATVGEPRDVMHSEFQRLGNALKGAVGGPLNTLNRYWAVPVQEIAYSPRKEALLTPERRAKYRALIRIMETNAREAVFAFAPVIPPNLRTAERAELVGDFFHSVIGGKLPGPPETFLRLCDYPWKQMPFHRIGRGAYNSYFGYAHGFADVIGGYMKKPAWKPDDLMSRQAWESMYNNVNRARIFCPGIIIQPDNVQDFVMDKIRYNIADGAMWTLLPDAQVEEEGLFKWTRAAVDEKSMRRILDAMRAGQFLRREDFLHLQAKVERQMLFRGAKKR